MLSELKEEEEKNKERSGGLPPGFRFHPTDEELITFYLASKVFNHPPSNYPNLPTLTTPSLLFGPAVHIPEVDLNRCEPWDLPGTYVFTLVWFWFSYILLSVHNGLDQFSVKGSPIFSPNPITITTLKLTYVLFKLGKSWIHLHSSCWNF